MVFDDEGLASAKQTFLPFGVAVYAPQVPNCPIRVGSTPPAAAAAACSGFAGLGAGLAAGAGAVVRQGYGAVRTAAYKLAALRGRA